MVIGPANLAGKFIAANFDTRPLLRSTRETFRDWQWSVGVKAVEIADFRFKISD
jgi:hypothetical protein